ncbi:hypothetical protein DFH11DRAFT_1727551 [Phellopilus nigrolimitatus]|nr:hypothetical protein DFH11DRAFT_1727551 [Phellopilus nigrolimitatus]
MADIPNFNGEGSVDGWIRALEGHFVQNGIPKNERVELAMLYLSLPVRGCIDSLAGFLETTSEETWNWTWKRLKAALRGINKQFDRLFKESIVKIVKTTAAVGAAFVAGPALFVGGLSLIGFSAVGPVAGSLAATAQSVFYGGAVQAGSAFAFCQSAAMGGSALVAVAEASAVGAAAIAKMKELAERPPSKSWADGEAFRPSVGLIEELREVA